MEQDFGKYIIVIFIIITLLFTNTLTFLDDDTHVRRSNDAEIVLPTNDALRFYFYFHPIDFQETPDFHKEGGLDPIPVIEPVMFPMKGDVTNHTTTEEAKQLAVEYKDTLYPDEDFSRQISIDLFVIRETFGVFIPIIRNITYRPPWVPYEIIISYENETWDKIIDGEYHAWDELNEEYNMTIKKARSYTNTRYFVLSFGQIIHPIHIASLYSDLPGVIYAEQNGYIGDHPSISMNQTGERIEYTFAIGGGDCPSGCTGGESWTFTVDDQDVIFLGYTIHGEDEWEIIPITYSD